MKYYKPINRAAFVSFHKQYYDYETFNPENIPTYVTLFGTRFLLTDWNELVFNYTPWDAVWNRCILFQKQLSAVLQKEYKPHLFCKPIALDYIS